MGRFRLKEEKRSDMTTRKIRIKDTRELEMVDLTGLVQEEIQAKSGKEGFVILFVPGSTGALTTIEFEPGLLRDFPEFLEKIIPSDRPYHHDLTWRDGNGHGHVRAALIGPSLTVPYKDGELLLGTWQQIVFIELDNRPRSRELILQIH
jgi:secondary thiamine-phosphate synthase enzyme